MISNITVCKFYQIIITSAHNIIFDTKPKHPHILLLEIDLSGGGGGRQNIEIYRQHIVGHLAAPAMLLPYTHTHYNMLCVFSKCFTHICMYMSGWVT